MARLRSLDGGIALIVLVLISPNLASKEDACRPICHGYSRTNDFKYQEGTTYKYTFQSAIQIALSDTKGGQQSTTGVKGTVLLSPISPCSHSLRLENVEVVGSNNQHFSHIDGITMPVQFHFHEGVLGDHICANTEDRHNSLNIKRSIASLFQVNMDQVSETDVFGVCPTIGTMHHEGGEIVINKIRDLDECSFRESIKEDFMVSSFDTESDFKTSPMLTGEYSSQQRIKNGIIDKAFVFENYTYLAFTDAEEKDELGAMAKVVTKLEYVGTSREYAQPIRNGEAKSIIFDDPHPITAERINMDSIITAIKKLKGENDLVVSEHAARDFLDLVKILRASNKDDMLIAFRQVKAGVGLRDREGARKVFLDALFRCGTGNAIVVGVELLKSRELTPFEEKLVYLSFAFVKHATLSALEAASSLLETHQLPREAYLGIGNLAGRYCRDHQCNVEAVNRLTQRLSAKLGYGRVYTREEENEIIFVLKALANIQHLDEGVIAKVTGIAHDKASPTRLRVSALETYLSDACHESVRTGALHVLNDIQEDSELRIKAYLVLAKCPNQHVARNIKELLDHEPSYQVGGFIVSHLRNLKASANPDRAAAQHVLGGINTNKKFPIDPRKYSFNGEFSYDLDTLGVSSSVEANVIYSQNSFLPRSTNLNLTAELFGHTVNFLEIGTRQQNLDRLFEHYFGPMGVFNQATPEELKQSSLHTLERIEDHFNRRLQRVRGGGRRYKRDVSKSEIDDFGRQVKIRTNELNNELDLDLSIKLFGSEMFFLSVSDDTENLSPEDIIDRLFDAYEIDAAKYRNFDQTYQSNTVFLDTEFVYPTSMGFPLRLGIEGTSAVQVKAKGDIDVLALMDETRNGGLFKLSLIPSASVEVAASITLDAQVFESGLKVVSNLYTATGGDLEVNLKDRDSGLEAKFSLPLQKQRIISATHEVVLNTRETGKPEILTPIKFAQNKDFNLCVNDLSPFIGINMCVDLNSPPTDSEDGPLLAGNYKFDLSLDNEDFGFFHYKEEYHEDPRRKEGGEVSAEIVGKRQNPKVALKLEAYYRPETYVRGSFVSPITNGFIEARLTNTYNEVSISYILQQDNQKYTGKAGLAIAPSGNDGTRCTPILEFHAPGGYGQPKLPFNVQGSFVVESRHPDYFKVIFEDLKLHVEDEYRNNQAYRGVSHSINGNVGYMGHDYFSDLTLSEGAFSIQILGKLNFQRNLIKLDGQVKHNRHPQNNIHIIYEFKRHPTEIDSILQLIHGSDPNSHHNKLTISDSLIYRRISDYDYEVQTKNKISYPPVGLDAQFDYTATPKTLLYDAEIKYGRYVVGSELDLKYSMRSQGDYDLHFQIYDSDDEVELKAKLDIQGELYRVDNSLVVNGQKYELSGTITNKNGHEYDMNADLLLRIPQSREPLQIHEEWRTTGNQKHFVFKLNDHYQEYIGITSTESKDASNANVKINIPRQLVLTAHGRETRGTGNGEFTLEYFPKRVSVKADTAFTIADPTYNIRLTIYPDFNHNRGQYLSLTSNNQIREDSIASKNTWDESGSKTQINFGMVEQDKDTSEKLAAELDITMPDGDFGSIKYNFNANTNNDKLNSEQSLIAEARGLYDWRNARVEIKEILRNVDSSVDTYDYTYLVNSDDGEGRVGHFEIGAKREIEGEDTVTEEAKIKIHGNRENDGLDVKATIVYDDDGTGTYDAFAKYEGGRYLIDMDGKYDIGGLFTGGPISEEFNLEIKTPNQELQDMKLNAAVSMKETTYPEGHIEIKGSGGFSLNEHQRSHYGTSLNFQGDGDLKVGPNDGTFKLTVSNRNADPVTITGAYDYTEAEKSFKLKTNVGVQYERYKHFKTDLAIDIPNEHEIKIDYGYEAPQSSPVRILIVAKESGKAYKGEAIVTTNRGRYVLIEELDYSDTTPGFNIQLTYPNGQVDQLLAKCKLDRLIEGEVKVKLHEHRFNLDSHLTARLDSEEDFSIKFTANCPSWEINNLIVDIKNSPLNGASPQNLLDNRFGYEDPRYTTEDPRYTTEDPRYTTEDPRYYQDPYRHGLQDKDERYNQDHYRNQDPRYDSRDTRHDSQDSRYDSRDTRYDNQDPRYPTEDPRYTTEDPRYTTEDPRYYQDPYRHGSQDKDERYNQDHYRNQDPRYDSRDTRHDSQDPRYDSRDTRHDNQDPRYDSRDTRYDSQDSRYDSQDPRYYNQDSRSGGAHDSRYDNQDSRYGRHDPKYDDQDSRRDSQTNDNWYDRYKRSLDQRYGDPTYGQAGYGDSRRREPYERYQPVQSQGETLQVSVQHAGRNVLSGSASYRVQAQGDSVTIEGAGSVRIKDSQPQQHSYKIVRQVVSSSRESGEGIEYTWYFDANSETINGKLRLAERDFAFLTTLCEQRSQCAKIQIDSRAFVFSNNHFEIVQNLEFDLRSFGWPEMGVSERVKYLNGDFDASGQLFVDRRNRYHYKLHGDATSFEASFTTPMRVVSLEGKVPFYSNPYNPAPRTFQIDLYLDKQRQPRQKSSLVGLIDFRGGYDIGKCNIEVKFTDPALRKDLTVVYTSNFNYPQGNAEYNLIIDIFNNPNNKIVCTGKLTGQRIRGGGASARNLYEIKSQGLEIDIKYEETLVFDPQYAREFKYNYLVSYHVGRATYDSAVTVQYNPQHVILLMKFLNRDLLNIDTKFSERGNTGTYVTNVRGIGFPPSTVNVDYSDNSFKLSISRIDNPSERLEFTANLLEGTLLDVNLKYYERGRPYNLISTYVRVNSRDELETLYQYDKENIQRLIIQPAKAEYANSKRQLSYIKSSAEKDLNTQLQLVDEYAKWDLPDFRPIKQYYTSELQKISRELESDRALQDFNRLVGQFLGPILEIFADIIVRMEEIAAKSKQSTEEYYRTLLEKFEREIQPWIRENSDKFWAAAEDNWEAAEKLTFAIIDALIDYINRHEHEIKAVGNVIIGSLEDVIVFAVKVERAIEEEITAELEKFYKELKSMAIFEELDEKLKQALEGRPIPESYIRNFREAVNNLKDSTDSPSLKKLISALADYVEKKLRRQTVDDAAAIEAILGAAYEVAVEIYEHLDDDDDDADLTLSWETIYAIPKLIEAELSPITSLLSGNWPDFEDMLEEISLDIDDWNIPEDMDAIVAQGQHIFTFDGKHLLFPGSCDYLFAHDAVNGNFSIVGGYRNGELISVTFTDKHDSVTIQKGGQVLLNQARAEYPIRRQHRLEVQRGYESITIWSKSGVKIVCGPELLVCGFHISGYYHAHLRGLLGNGNNEPYDDYTLPNGLIVNKEDEFGNSYKIGRHCQDVRTMDPRVRQRNPGCTRLFNAASPLSSCFNYVDPEIFRTACDRGSAAGGRDTQHAIAVAYVAACATKGLDLEVPENLVTCHNHDKPVRIDEEFTVMTPGRSADIVLLVDQDKINEYAFRELIQPLTSELTNSLSREGVSDVDFHLIGYGGEYEKRPAHYTVDGKLTFKGGRTPNLHFSAPLKEAQKETFMEYIERFGDEVELLTGQDMLSEAYKEATEYPFRAGALKSIIVLNGKPCDEAQLEVIQVLSSLFVLNKQLTVNLFTPFKGIDPRNPTQSNIIGFNEHTIYSYSNPAGSKQNNAIQYDNFCVEFALKNRGNVFVTNNFVQGRNKQQYIQIASQTITKELTNVNQYLECKCEMVSAYTAHNVCEVKHSEARITVQQPPLRRRQHG